MSSMLQDSGLVSQLVPFSPILNPTLTAHLHTRGIDVARAEARTFVEGRPADQLAGTDGPGPVRVDFPGRTRNTDGLQGWF